MRTIWAYTVGALAALVAFFYAMWRSAAVARDAAVHAAKIEKDKALHQTAVRDADAKGAEEERGVVPRVKEMTEEELREYFTKS